MSWLLEQLRKHKEDRGLMADLRCALVAGKRHRAWPAMNRLNVKVTDDVAAIIAGLYATHPEEAHVGNLGDTCKAIEKKRNENTGKDKDTKLTPTERRFQHLLAAGNSDELFDRVARMVRLAKSSQGVPINYEQLEKDLRRWFQGNQTKIEWASAFWVPNAEPVPDEEGA